MDAHLNFANARKFRQFCMNVLQVSENQGRDTKFLIVDGKTLNGIDATGLEALEHLAANMSSRQKRLIVANLKSSTSQLATKMALPEKLKKHSGAVCTSLNAAFDIVNGVDKSGSKANLTVLRMSKSKDGADAWQRESS